MKNRKSIIVMFLIAVVLCVGVGFAAVSDTLTIGGTASVGDITTNFDSNVYFSAAQVVNAKDGDSAITTGTKPDDASFTCGSLLVENDEAKFKFTVKNDNDIAASVAINLGTNTGDTDYFEITTDYNASSATISAGGTWDVIVTVKLVKTPVEDKTCGCTITLTVTGVENAD